MKAKEITDLVDAVKSLRNWTVVDTSQSYIMVKIDHDDVEDLDIALATFDIWDWDGNGRD